MVVNACHLSGWLVWFIGTSAKAEIPIAFLIFTLAMLRISAVQKS